jgi:hypothetical protein
MIDKIKLGTEFTALIVVFILGTIFASASASAQMPLGGGLGITVKVPIFCNGSMSQYEAACSDFTDQRLVEIAQSSAALVIQPECEWNPDDIGCENPQPGFSFDPHEFIIIDTSNGTVNVKNVSLQPWIGIVVASGSSNSYQQLAYESYLLNNEYEYAKSEMTWSPSANGDFVNGNGVSLIDDFNFYAGTTSTQSGNTPASNPGQEYVNHCISVISYQNNSQCAAQTTAYLDAKYKDPNSFLTQMWDRLTGFSFDYGELGFSVNFVSGENYESHSIAFGPIAVLVFKIVRPTTEGQPPTIEIDKNASRTAQGLSFTEAEVRANNPGMGGFGLSGASLFELLRGSAGSSCVEIALQIGWERDYLVTQDEDGNIISYQLMGQVPIYQYIENCTANVFNVF